MAREDLRVTLKIVMAPNRQGRGHRTSWGKDRQWVRNAYRKLKNKYPQFSTLLERWDGDPEWRKSLKGTESNPSRFDSRERIAYGDAIYTNDNDELEAMGMHLTEGVTDWYERNRRGWTRTLVMKTDQKGGNYIPKKFTHHYQRNLKIPVRVCKFTDENHFLVGTYLEDTWGEEGHCISCGHWIKFNDYCGFCAKCNRSENRDADMDENEKVLQWAILVV